MPTHTDYSGKTLRFRVIGNVLLCVHSSAPSDEDWEQAIDAAREIQESTGVTRVVAVALREDCLPTTAQRTLATARMDPSHARLAVVGVGTFLRIVLKAFSLFMPNARMFAPGETYEALKFVGVDDVPALNRQIEQMVEAATADRG